MPNASCCTTRSATTGAPGTADSADPGRHRAEIARIPGLEEVAGRADDQAVTDDVVALLLDDDLPPARLGRMLRDARRRHGLKRRDVATATGIPADRLRAYERGTVPIPAEACARLVGHYGDDLTAHVPLRVPVHVGERRIVAGEEVRALATRRADDVLRAYTELLLRLRHARPGEPVPLRASDLAALAAAVGDDADAVETRITELLGCTREEAAGLRAALMRRRLIVPVAGLAAGAALVVAAAAGATGADPVPAPVPGADPTVSFGPDAADAPVAGMGADVPAASAPLAPRVFGPAVTAAPPAAPEPTDATVPPGAVAPDVPQPVAPPGPADDPPVSVPPGEEFVEIGTPAQEP
jgi:transcriptional regulator with XRE-family HTH domain